VLVGPPASGKTTLARALAREVDGGLAHVENDALRGLVAGHLHDDGSPRFSEAETRGTYELARRLVRRALERGRPAVRDATNLDADARAATLRAARSTGATGLLVPVQTPEAVRRRRAREAGAAAERAHEALGDRAPGPLRDRHPTVHVDGTADPLEQARALDDRLAEVDGGGEG